MTERMQITLTAEAKQQLKELAEQNNRSQSNMIVTLINEAYKKTKGGQ